MARTSGNDALGIGPPPSATSEAPSIIGLPTGAYAGITTGTDMGRGPGGPGGGQQNVVAGQRPTPWGSNGGGGYTEQDLFTTLAGMPAEELARVQRKMQSAGLIGPETRFTLGQMDSTTKGAFAELLGLANTRAMTWQTMLDSIHVRGEQGLAAARQDALREKRRATELSFGTRLNTYERSDPASIRQTVEAAFREAVGRKPRSDELDKFVTRFLSDEQRNQETVFNVADQLDQAERQRARAAVDGEGGGGIDAFMEALSGQESGGDYNARNGRTGASGRFQIMPGNWAPWAKEAGLGANAARTPENQDRVARFKMQQYYDQFGSWDAVAVAWYAGPGAVKGYLENPNAPRYTRKQGKGNEPSIKEYVQQVSARLGGMSGGGATSGSSEADILWNNLQRLIADAPGKVTPGPRSRDYATQVKLWERYKAGKGPLAAKPGTSKHGNGRANDLKYENQATKRWVLNNAHRYGLAFPLLNHGEDWHIELADGHYQGDGHNHGGSAAPVSRDVVAQRQDVGAQAREYARNANPTEARAFDVGGQFQNMMALLQRGIGV